MHTVLSYRGLSGKDNDTAYSVLLSPVRLLEVKSLRPDAKLWGKGFLEPLSMVTF